MTPAQLERVQLERRKAHDDGAGNANGAWEKLGGVLRATITETNGGEAVLAAKLQGRQVCTVELRAAGDVRGLRTSDRIIDLTNGRVLKIRHVPGMPRAGFVTIICEAGVAT